MGAMIIMSFLLLGNLSWAQEEVSSSSDPSSQAGEHPAKRPYPNPFSISLETADWEYSEPGYMTDSGRLYGLKGAVETVSQGGLYAGGHLSFMAGNTQYDGHLWSGEEYKTGSQNSILELEGRLGPALSLGTGASITPFAGFSYWILTNPQQDNDPADYTRTISYTSLPVGMASRFRIGESVTLGLTGTYYVFLGGKVDTRLSDVNPALTDVELRQDKGKGMNIAANMSFQLTSSEIGLSAYYRTWDVENSQIGQATVFDKYGNLKTSGVLEPKNQTRMLGLSFYVSF